MDPAASSDPPMETSPEPKSTSVDELEALRGNFVEALERATQELRHPKQNPRPQIRLWRLFEPVFASIVAFAIALATGFVDIELSLPLPANLVAQSLPLSSIPAPSKFAGTFEPTHVIKASNTRRLFEGILDGPEHVAFDDTGALWTASANGTLFTAARGTGAHGELVFSAPQEQAFVGPGRPLGLAPDNAGGVYICNSLLGLLYWKSGSSQLTILANRVSPSSALRAGSFITFANSVTAAASGKVYFTASGDVPPSLGRKGTYETLQAAYLTIVSGSMRGMLLEYDVTTGVTTCLLDGLWFANGVALSKDQDFLVLADTGLLQVHKVWIAGPQAGQSEVLLSNLPAYPDNLNANDDGTFWLGLAGGVAPVTKIAWIFRNKFLRTVMAHLPRWMRPKEIEIGGGIQFDGDGRVLKTVLDASGRLVASTTSGKLLGDRWLVMGNLNYAYVAITDLAAAEAGTATL